MHARDCTAPASLELDGAGWSGSGDQRRRQTGAGMRIDARHAGGPAQGALIRVNRRNVNSCA
jgi:hypothetical protein